MIQMIYATHSLDTKCVKEVVETLCPRHCDLLLKELDGRHGPNEQASNRRRIGLWISGLHIVAIDKKLRLENTSLDRR